jgi:isopenicillin N synthase-like dioxygenase
MSADFSAVPALDYTLLSSPNTRAEFISQLRHALIDVGFLYLVNPPVSPALISQLVQYVPRLFEDLNQAEKDALAMSNSAQFLGYSRLGAEQTKARTDMREQYDFATEFECRWKPGDPEYLRLWGASQVMITGWLREISDFCMQWPPEEKIPGFSSIMQQYLQAVQTLGYEFISLVSEALGLSSTGLDVFYNPKSELQHRAKVKDQVPYDRMLASKLTS